ncbi:methyl-accepting chemotaxis protein [Undibacterium sp. SXout11W]|uniref:methyl-accepting chemotaxis protein n=1 Tax=Undibacterium sp. SXout11W TaxID=3413050 RepID=UPI003BF2D351
MPPFFRSIQGGISRLLGNFSLRTKLLAVFAMMLIPIFGTSIFVLQRVNTDLETATSELRGLTFTERQIDVMVQVQKYRGLVNLKLAGENVEPALEKIRTLIKAESEQVSLDIKTEPHWQLSSDWQPIYDELQHLAAGQIAANSAENMLQHTTLIKRLQQLISLTAEQSGLLLDPSANSYYLVDASIQKLPVWIEQIAQLRGLGAGYIRSKNMPPDGKSRVVSRIDTLLMSQEAIDNLRGALQRSGETLPEEQAATIQASQELITSAKKNLLGEDIVGDANAFFEQGTVAISKALKLQESFTARLNILLSERVARLGFIKHLVLTLVTLFGLLIFCLFSVFYADLLKAVASLGDSAKAVSAGDLTRQIHLDGKDELAVTGKILEEMNLNLSSLVANVRSNAHMVSQVGQGLAHNISDLSARTEQQASSLEQTSASVEDLADTVKNNADSAAQVDRMASTVSLIAESGGETMQQAVRSMQQIQSSALKVQDIISIIDGIAFQTNILALNAAVEAARAGEQGRGFAVVASEVRNLAQRSSASAKEIRLLIDESVHHVKTGVQQINDVNQTLADIVKGIRDLAGSINAISMASVEQSNGLSQISEALKNLDEITQSNGQMADHAKHVAINLEERANLLSNAVAAFKLRQGTADEAFALVQKAVALYQQVGQRALATITTNAQHLYADKDMYVFAFNRQGQYLAFGGNAEKLKVNLFNLPGLDGRQLVHDAFALPAEGGWVDYSITNPVSQKVEHKTSYIEAVAENLVIGCGIYKT